MTNSPFISWQEWENHVLDLFQLILSDMARQPSLPRLEAHKKDDSLNRRLYRTYRKSIADWRKAGGRPNFELVYNGRNQPRDMDETPHSSEQKEPDFSVYSYFDSVSGFSCGYSVECKRLDNPAAQYGQEYVKKGIARFLNREHSYSIDTPSGLMIGYVQSSNHPTFLKHVNRHAGHDSIAALAIIGHWEQIGVSRLEQNLNRPVDMPPLLFKLRHLWVDVRHNCG